MTHAEHPIVDTKLGKLKGFVKEEVQTFLGIQYGKSTAGARRFMPPEPPESWPDVKEALDFGPICPQGGSLADHALADNQVIGPLPKLPLSEDCLYLNVWTPAVKDNGKRPVLFWLHGRGFAEGAGSEGWYDGTNLSKKGDVVVVTIKSPSEYIRLPLSGRTGWRKVCHQRPKRNAGRCSGTGMGP